MIDAAHATLMARYNHWMNEKLYAASAGLSDEQRKEDRGAFFKSIHGTLKHLVLADTAWLHRFTGRSFDGLNPSVDTYDDFEAMSNRRIELDGQLCDWASTITPAWAAANFTYHRMADGAQFTRPAWTLVVHVFNHQAHHRGQATTLLTQLGIDVGVTDLPGLPDFA